MFEYNIALYEKNNSGVWGWQDLDAWTRPFSDGTRLDETLDGGTINISCTTRYKAIKPFTRVRIIIKENSAQAPTTYTEIGRIYRLVGSTKRTKRRFAETTLYDWTINTIELTKLLERRLISTMTVTKPLSGDRAYDSQSMSAPHINGNAYDVTIHSNIIPTYKLYIPTGTIITIPQAGGTGIYHSNSWVTITGSVGVNYKAAIVTNTLKKSDGTVVATAVWTSDNPSGDNSITHTIEETGTYTITTYWAVYLTQTEIDTNQPHTEGNYEWSFVSYTYETMPELPTITSVCERLLESGICRRKDIETQEFLLDPTFASDYEHEISPEFSFTNCTLFEALLQVGKHIHAIPRLIPRYEVDNSTQSSGMAVDDTHYYVTFDKLGGDENAPKKLQFDSFNDRGEYDNNALYLYDDLVHYKGNYYWYKAPLGSIGASPEVNTVVWEELNTYVYSEKTIDANDWCGKVDSPSQNMCDTENVAGGAITELGGSYVTVRTEDAQVEISADNVLIRTSKPIQQIVKVENSIAGDITAYVYEGAEYKTLSSYWGEQFPYSKGWAIYYNQGDNKIQGLSFRLTQASTYNSAKERYAIVNIINEKTGQNNGVVSGKWMRELAFKVTYVPIAESRVTARKPCLVEGADGNNELVYNQGANVAETSYYGEAMRGAIARLGQDAETRTYDIFTLNGNINNLPKCGQILDGKYIATIDTEYDITKIRFTLTLTHYNMLSQFVGLDSNYRLYDISEKQSVERNVNYNELVVVGDAPNVNMSRYLMLRDLVNMCGYEFTQNSANQKLQVAKLTPFDENGDEIPNRAVILPVVAFPFGTSFCLNVSYLDNYGAGYQSSNAYEGEVNKGVQRLVPYTDSFGEIKYLQASFKNSTGWTQSSASAFEDDSPAMLYPQLTTADDDTGRIRTSTHYIDLSKDSREKINFTYQCHYVTTRNSIIIGSGLAKYNPYVGGTGSNWTYVCWLKHSISIFNKYITIGTGEQAVLNANVSGMDTTNQRWNYSAGTCPIDGCKAYAVCKQVTINGETAYELLFGENFDDGLARDATPPTITFAGALEQACILDENCLKFIKSGKNYYTPTSNTEMAIVAALTQDFVVNTTIDTSSQYSGVKLGEYFPIDISGTTYYVRKQDLVTAYNL